MLRGNWREALGWGSPRATACWIVAIAIVAALLLAAPGQTVSARYLNDLMMFLDGAHRIVSGQVPHRDFHTPMGAVTNGLPAIGLWLTGSLGAAMPTGVGLLILALAPVMAYVLTSRLRPAFALPMAVYLSLILAAPANLGESPGALSFAMFFNRIGWAALSLLLILFLPPRIGPRVAADGICAAVLTLLMLYTKASFGLVAAGFLACLLLDQCASALGGARACRDRGGHAGSRGDLAAAERLCRRSRPSPARQRRRARRDRQHLELDCRQPPRLDGVRDRRGGRRRRAAGLAPAAVPRVLRRRRPHHPEPEFPGRRHRDARGGRRRRGRGRGAAERRRGRARRPRHPRRRLRHAPRSPGADGDRTNDRARHPRGAREHEAGASLRPAAPRPHRPRRHRDGARRDLHDEIRGDAQ